MIEGVEEAGTEHESVPLSESKRPLNRKIPRLQPGRHQRITGAVPKFPYRRLREGTKGSIGLSEIMELVVDGSNAIEVGVRIPDAIAVVKCKNWGRETVAQSRGPRNLPVTD